MTQNKMKLTFITQENIPANLQSQIISNYEKFGWLAFLPENKINPETIKDLPEIEKLPEENKTPSQRLRGVLYVLCEQKGRPTETFETYYRMHYEKIIEQYKEKLT